MVPGERIELSLCFQNRILNPARLPVPPPRHALVDGACNQVPRLEAAQYMRGNAPPPEVQKIFAKCDPFGVFRI